jgi:ADP-ribose pyrophosphatase
MVEPAAPGEYELRKSEPVYEGHVITLVNDTVGMPDGGSSVREVVRHPGAVAVVALDDDDNVVLLRQYRHPVGGYLWELPAGLRDADGEPPLETAKRELAEEVALAAERWSLLTTSYSTPGFCDELVLVYLTEGLWTPTGRRASPPSTRSWTCRSSGCRSPRRCSGSTTATSATRPP